MTEIPALACAYHAMGFNVLPLDRDKRPVGEWTRWQTKRQTVEEVTALPWRRVSTAGVGAVWGPSRGILFVSTRIGRPARVCSTASSGVWATARLRLGRPDSGQGWEVALWVRCPGLAEKGLPSGVLEADYPGADHIELRWDGHYTVLPGSAHPEGGSYEWVVTERHAPAGRTTRRSPGRQADPPCQVEGHHRRGQACPGRRAARSDP